MSFYPLEGTVCFLELSLVQPNFLQDLWTLCDIWGSLDSFLGTKNGFSIDFVLFSPFVSSIPTCFGMTTAPGITNLFSIVVCLGVVYFFGITTCVGFMNFAGITAVFSIVNSVGVTNCSKVANFPYIMTYFGVP